MILCKVDFCRKLIMICPAARLYRTQSSVLVLNLFLNLTVCFTIMILEVMNGYTDCN